VFFDDVPSPLIYVSSGQVSAILPYSVSGRASSQLRIEYLGRNSNSVVLPVRGSAPAFFTANSTGIGQGAFLNQDGSVNNTANPAELGTVVVLYATGEGQTSPSGVDGRLATEVFPKPVLPVSVQISGVDAQILYAGAAPGLVAGVLQVNARVPVTVAPGLNIPIQMTIGGVSSRFGVTLAVR
jgi:uncharacterized protein (TIGR03437 family)